MIEKEYTKIEQQIEILRKRKLVIDPKDEELLKTYLLEYGYERVITGSNSLFKTLNNNEYDKNSKAKHLMMAFDIDRNISSEIFKYLSKSAEIKINTIIANTIAGILSKEKLQNNGLIFGINNSDYQKIFPNYKNSILDLKRIIAGESIQNGLYDLEIQEIEKDFENIEKKIKEKEKVIANIKDSIEKLQIQKNNNINQSKEKLKYCNLYLPIWKIANTWTLASTINIFKFINKECKREIIENTCPKFKELKINHKEFNQILFWIKIFRNMLAHNYSIYKMGCVLKKEKYEYFKEAKINLKQNQKYNCNKFNNFIEKLKKAQIISNNDVSNNQVKISLMTFVKLLEVFLNIDNNKIQKAIEKIIEDKITAKIKNDNSQRIKEKTEEEFKKIIEDKLIAEIQNEDNSDVKKIKEKIQEASKKIIEDKLIAEAKDGDSELKKLKEEIQAIINGKFISSK